MSAEGMNMPRRIPLLLKEGLGVIGRHTKGGAHDAIPSPPARGMEDQRIVFQDISKFYGEVLGVNRVNLSIPPGITSLVGPNGSGKTTLMNLMTGLVRPTRGCITVLGISAYEPERLFRKVGYCTQFDSFPRGLTGYQFIYSYLRLAGESHQVADRLAVQALERVNLREAAHHQIAGYSKGMRQRIKLAQAMSHNPSVLVLDEPLNGLDPLIRAETIALFRSLAQQGLHVVISSHVLHEVDAISDQVVLLSNGYVVAEGQIHGVREEIREHPMQILIRCNKPRDLASQVFQQDCVVEARIHADGQGVLVKTRDADRFYLLLNRIAQNGIDIESVAPADDDVLSVYEYLIGAEEATK
jgi:ABC-2 type transport system ATP-binding protein